MASYRKRGSKWEYRIRYKDPFTQEFKEKTKGGFTTKKEAQLAASEDEKKLLEGYQQEEVSLNDYLITWLNEYKKDTVRKNTFELHKRNIVNHIIPFFKNIKLRDIKPIMYQKFLNQLKVLHLWNQITYLSFCKLPISITISIGFSLKA